MMDILLILFLIVLNGVFAMAEIAIVSSRRTRLQTLADEGEHGAVVALELHGEPSSFLSTIQIGITGVAILSGAIGERALADPLAGWLQGFPLLAPYSKGVALALAVVALTYLSVVIGELVPKRLALLGPESIAAVVARPLAWLSRAATPLVWALSGSSSLLLRMLPGKPRTEPPISDEEIDVLMEQGAEAGVFHESEQAIVANVLRLDEQRVAAIMTHRKDIYYIDVADAAEINQRKVADSPHSRLIVCRGGLEHILGVLEARHYLQRRLKGEAPGLAEHLLPPLYVPDSVSTTQLMESLRKARSHLALIVDEYGELQGLVTLTDVLTAIVGELPSHDEEAETDIVRREDGSWLVDGMLPTERFKDFFELDALPEEDSGLYNTLGGFVMLRLGRIPAKADHFEYAGLRFEVVDMDRHRVDQVLISRLPHAARQQPQHA